MLTCAEADGRGDTDLAIFDLDGDESTCSPTVKGSADVSTSSVSTTIAALGSGLTDMGNFEVDGEGVAGSSS